jgi:hypothetical protein
VPRGKPDIPGARGKKCRGNRTGYRNPYNNQRPYGLKWGLLMEDESGILFAIYIESWAMTKYLINKE